MKLCKSLKIYDFSQQLSNINRQELYKLIFILFYQNKKTN